MGGAPDQKRKSLTARALVILRFLNGLPGGRLHRDQPAEKDRSFRWNRIQQREMEPQILFRCSARAEDRLQRRKMAVFQPRRDVCRQVFDRLPHGFRKCTAKPQRGQRERNRLEMPLFPRIAGLPFAPESIVVSIFVKKVTKLPRSRQACISMQKVQKKM